MDLNDGLFTQNGRSGYVLKPEILRNRERFFDPEKPEEREDYHPLLFSVKVLNSICVSFHHFSLRLYLLIVL